MRRLLLVVFALACARGLSAQACIGVPSGDGQTALAGSVSFTTGAKFYGAGVAANLAGPVSLFGGYSLITVDDVSTRGNSFGGGVAFELSIPSVSICPGAGVDYSRFHEEELGEELTFTNIAIPVGVGIGKTFPAGTNFYVTLFGEPQFLYIRSKVSFDTSAGAGEVSENSNEFGAVLGIRFGSASFYAGAGVSLSTIEDSDPTFGLTAGILLGTRR